jgi:outer membrane protein OmpA-like peptidoglycan-associated protein
VLGVASLLAPSLALAQSQQRFALDQFEPAPAGDRFFGVQGGDPGGHLKPRWMLLGEYAYRPLVLYADNGNSRLSSVVSDQLFAHASLALGLWQDLALSLDLPIALLTSGDSPAAGGLSFASPSGAALGDLRLAARYRFAGEASSAFQLSLAGALWLPSGDRQKFAGDGAVRGIPSLVANGELGGFVYAATVGIALRGQRQFSDTTLGSQFAFGAAAGVLLVDRKLQLGPELYGTTVLQDPFARDDSNFEAIFGAKYRASDWVFGAAAGPGLSRGIGTPALRAIASIAWAPLAEQPEPADRDHDGILDGVDACPDAPGISSDRADRHGCPDGDRDGVFDRDDACVTVPGVRTSDPLTNGCPKVVAADRDRDGVPDTEDACPDLKGVKSDNPKQNGCPSDRDGDGVYDSEDACVDLPGLRTEDPQSNGCPGDSDGDGIRDDRDACPREKGKEDADPAKNGCPALVRVTGGEIVILQQVQFKTGSDLILPASDALLEEVASVLREHPEITLLEIQGHTDSRGNPGYNKALSQRRAQSVLKWLSTRGKLAASRFSARGFGQEQPIADNETDQGRQQNRRVQFKIVESQPATNVQE